jgi:hypothetical protein
MTRCGDDHHIDHLTNTRYKTLRPFKRRCSMSVERNEAFATIGTRVQLHDYEEDDVRTSFSEQVPAGTTGQVIHANLVCRFTHPEYEPVDVYEYVIEWDALNRRIDMFDASDYGRFITELE